MSPWIIFLVVLGPFAVFGAWIIYSQITGKFREPAPEKTESDFGQRHPVLATIAIVFGLGFLSGGFIDPADNILRSAFFCGAAGAVLFLTLTSVPALLMTLFQSFRNASERRALAREITASDADVAISLDPFRQRFLKNLDSTMEFLAQGWLP